MAPPKNPTVTAAAYCRFWVRELVRGQLLSDERGPGLASKLA
jgi:hypothetical protein